MQHGVGRLVGRDEVGEHADVAVTVDVDTEGVLILPVAGIDVAARDDRLCLEPDAFDGPPCEIDDVGSLEEWVEVDGAVGWRLLEERIRVVPGTEFGDRAPEPSPQALVERRLPARERLRGRPVGLRERLDELSLVELVGREREREPVSVTE